MALDREVEIVARHAFAVVADADQAPAAAVGEHLDAARAGIECVLDELLHHAGRTFHHFARGDAVDHGLGELADRHLGFRFERNRILTCAPRLIHLRLGLAQALDTRAALLAFQPSRPRGFCRLGRSPRLRRDRGLADQVDQALQRVVAVALLGAVALRRDDHHAIVGEPAAGQPFEPRAHRVGQRWRVAHVEAQLYGGRDLVDILPARTRGADEALLDLALVDGDRIGDADHLLVIPGRPRSSAPGIHNHRRCDNGKTRGYGFRPWRFALGRNDRLNDFSVNLPPVSAGRPREGGDPMTTTLAETQWRWVMDPGSRHLRCRGRDDHGRSAALTLGGDALRTPDHRDQEPAIEQTLRHAPHVGDGHGIDHGAAAVDIVDAEIVELDLYQLSGDLGRGVEAERIGSLEIGFRLRQLLVGRAGLRQAADLLLDDLDGLACAFGPRAGAAHQHGGMVEPYQLAVDRIGEPALLAHLAIEAR